MISTPDRAVKWFDKLRVLMKNILDVKALEIFLCFVCGLGYLISVFSDVTFINATFLVGGSILVNGIVIFLLDFIKKDK